MTYTLAVVNQKGGVGKTTTAANVADVLARRGLEVLLVDLDPQGSATRLTDATPQQTTPTLGEGVVDLTVSDALYATQARADAPVQEGLLHQVTVPSGPHWSEHLTVAPANQDLAQRGAENFRGAEARLAAALRADHGPQLVVIDCPPTLGILFAAALHAADGVLVVSEPADGSVEGLPLTHSALEQVRAERGSQQAPQLLGIVVTNVPAREQRAGQLLDHLREQYGNQVWEAIPRRAVVRQAEGAGAPVSAYGAAASEVTSAYEAVADRLLAVLPITEGAHS